MTYQPACTCRLPLTVHRFGFLGGPFWGALFFVHLKIQICIMFSRLKFQNLSFPSESSFSKTRNQTGCCRVTIVAVECSTEDRQSTIIAGRGDQERRGRDSSNDERSRSKTPLEIDTHISTSNLFSTNSLIQQL